MTARVETLVRALWKPILLRGIGFWLGVRAMIALVVLIFGIEGVGFPSIAIPVTVIGLAWAHSATMREIVYYRNLGIRWLPIGGPALVAMGMEIVIALMVHGG